MSCATPKKNAENRTCTNVCYEYECAMSNKNGLGKIECFTLSSLPPPPPSPPPPLSFTLSRSLSLDHNLSFRRETDRQRDRQACRQTDIQTDRQVGRQVDRPTDRQTDRQTRADSLAPFASPQPSAASLTNLKHWHTLSLPTTFLFQKVVGQVAGTRIKIHTPPRGLF